MNLNLADTITKAEKLFTPQFGNHKTFHYAISPASIIFLGDHTHYNDGILISAAVDKYSWAAVRKRADNSVNLYRKNTDKLLSFSLSEIEKVNEAEGFKMIIGITAILKNENLLTSGFDCIFDSSVPQWLGLGGLASQQMAVIAGLKKAFGFKESLQDLIRYVRTNELKLVGKISNIANYYTIAYGKKSKLILTDLRSREFKSLPLGENEYKIVICNTGEEIDHVENICNERIEECEVGVKGLRLYIWGIKNLRDVQLDFLMRHLHMIPRKIFARVLYNVTERIRAEEAVKFFKQKKIKDFGTLITKSHGSLSLDYEISNDKLDFIVTQSGNLKGVAGSKMISCSPLRSTFHLVETNRVENFVNQIRKIYFDKFNEDLETHILNIADGVKVISRRQLNSL